MGIEYSIIRRDNHTYFDLGKGMWYDVLDHLDDLPTYFERVTEFWNWENVSKDEYFSWLEDEIRKFIADAKPDDLAVIDDCGDRYIIVNPDKDLREVCGYYGPQYKLAGSRFWISKGIT